ncbi:MAG: DUF6794 domain-containing protein, partial [Candidatus Thorarchaeota archaeon]
MKTPKNLEEAIEIIKKNTNIRDTETEEHFTSDYHHTLGRDIRNNWGFWQDSPLKQELIALGLHHPDDMSGLILQCAYRDLKGIPRDIPGIVKYYQDYWKTQCTKS